MRRRHAVLVALAVALASLVSCGGGATLVVDLRTDLRPGYQFFSVELLVNRADGSLARRSVVPVTRREDYLDGQRVAEAVDLARGSYLVDTRLLDLDGNVVTHRNTSVEVRGDVAITVVISSDCRGLVCPSASSSRDETECLGARCVTPACAAGDTTACPPPRCVADTDCMGAVACAPARCVLGICLAHPDDALCPTGQWCDPSTGCLDTPVLDAGVLDAGTTDGGDAGPGVDAGDAGGSCVPGASCSTGRACETGAFQCPGGVRTCVATGVRGSGTVCRPAAGPCDTPESCDGSSPTCPSDGFVTGGVCRGAAGPCDYAESCDGTSADCPVDRTRHTGTCRASTGVCDVEETCGSAGADCPPDDFAPNGTSCGPEWSENSCGPIPTARCMGGSCVHDGSFSGTRPSCGAIGTFCGFTPACCGMSGYFCVSPGTIYGSSSDCGQCCTPGNCCVAGNPSGPCM